MREKWVVIQKYVERHVSQHASACLRDAEPVCVKGNKVTIGFDPEFAGERDEMLLSNNKLALQRALTEQLQRSIELELNVLPGKELLPNDVPVAKGPNTISNEVAAGKVKQDGQRDLSREARDRWMSNEKVALVLEKFNGDIIDIRV